MGEQGDQVVALGLCQHCWHGIGSGSGISRQVCCWCGRIIQMYGRAQVVDRHGPYEPADPKPWVRGPREIKSSGVDDGWEPVNSAGWGGGGLDE